MPARPQVGSYPLRVSASLAAGGAAEKAALIFRKHDQDDDNSLNKQEMLAALEEMGVLHGIKAKHVGEQGRSPAEPLFHHAASSISPG